MPDNASGEKQVAMRSLGSETEGARRERREERSDESLRILCFLFASLLYFFRSSHVTLLIPQSFLAPRFAPRYRFLVAVTVCSRSFSSSEAGHYTQRARFVAASRPGSVHTDQFLSLQNYAAHYHGTGPEIASQLPDLDVFACGAGTGGTIAGAGTSLKQSTEAQVVLVDFAGSGLKSYVSTGEWKKVRALAYSRFFCPACEPLFNWVSSQIHYSEIFNKVEPLKDEVNRLQQDVEEVIFPFHLPNARASSPLLARPRGLRRHQGGGCGHFPPHC